LSGTFRCYGNGFPAKREGVTAEVQLLPVAAALGRQKDILRTVTKVECYHSCVGFCRECWNFSRIHGFLFDIQKGS